MLEKTYINDLSILCGADKITYDEGKAKGMSFIHMYNGRLDLMLSVDRALDIYKANFLGKNVSFISKNGPVNPKLSSSAVSFVNDFGGGLLYTCGLDNIGSPREHYIQHGSLSYLPAKRININHGYIDDNYYVSVEGDVHYTSLFGHDFVLKRKITLYYNQPHIIINDEVINQNGFPDNYMLMYHMNFGYPLINEHSKISIHDVKKTEIFNKEENRKYSDYYDLEKPEIKKPEEVFVHELVNKQAHVDIINKDDRVKIAFNSNKLPYLTQWKSMATGDYALGIEPASTSLLNRKYTTIEAYDKHAYDITITFQDIKGEKE